MKSVKQTVYIPVSEFNSSERAICTIGIPDLYGDKVIEQEAFVFTPEQLNGYTANVIKQALETAAENAFISNHIPDEDDDRVYKEVNKQSITNTFEETFKKFEV